MFEITAVSGEIGDRDLREMARLFELAFERPPPDDFADPVREKRRPLALLAWRNGSAVSYKLGYERSRGLFYSWLGGVDPAARRGGPRAAPLPARVADEERLLDRDHRVDQ